VLLVLATSLAGQWVVFAPQQALRLLEHGVPHPAPARGGPFADQINGAAARHGLDPTLVAAVVAIESSFDPSAVSPMGARGLMQVMPPTWPSSLLGSLGAGVGEGNTPPRPVAGNRIGLREVSGQRS
jgi:hypothetical protein